MLLQSIVLYSTLILIMLSFAFFLAKTSHVSNGRLVYHSKEMPFFRFNTILPILIFSVFFGVRYDVGADHISYLEGYVRGVNVGKGELLFVWLTNFFRELGLHFSWYFTAIAFIQSFFFFYAFNEDRYIYPLLILFLFTNGDFLFWMNGMRQAIALCIWIYALKYIEHKNLWKYFLFCLLAYGFHSSAIILIILYPVLRNGKDYFSSIKLQLILFCSAFLLQQIFLQIFTNLLPFIEKNIVYLGNEAYEGYVRKGLEVSDGSLGGSGIAYFFRIGLALIIILYSERLKQFYNSKRFNIIYFMFFIGLITFYMFPVGSVILTRPFRYFYAFQFIMYAYFCYYLYKSHKANDKRLFVALVIIFLGIFYLSQSSANENSHLLYQTYF